MGTRLSLLSCAALVSMSCAMAGDDAPPVELRAHASDSSGIRLVELSAAPALASGWAGATILRADLELGGDTDGFIHIGDVATLTGGSIVVLDRGEAHLMVFDTNGRVVRRIGRRGEGPGELTNPVAVAAVGAHLVVLEPRVTRTLTVFDTLGRVERVISAPIDGDWEAVVLRGPRLFVEYPRVGGPEDLSRRLTGLGTTAFVTLLAPNEVRDPSWIDRDRPAHWIRFGLDGAVRDTLAVSEAPQLRRGVPVVHNQLSSAEEPLYASRPHFASGAGWYAIGHGRDHSVTIHDTTGDIRTIIRWPSTARDLTAEDRLVRAHWSGEYTLRFAAGARENAARLSQRQIDEQYRQHAARLPFSARTPEIMAMHGAGRCLWMAGFVPDDNPTGASSTWVGVDVESGGLAAVVTLPERDLRVRHFDERAVYASYWDSLNVAHVARFPLPREVCRAG